jgi:hypothetical protein
MNLSVPEVRVGEPMRCEGLAVFPLYSELPPSRAEYVLAHEAVAAGTAIVREVSPAGSVAELLVENHGDLPCLILEGTELRGSKQTRVLNATVLVGSGSRVRIPVSCVERGRWRDDSPRSGPGSHCPPTLRGLLKGSAHGRRLGLGSCQVAVWAEIRRRHRALGVTSATEDLSAAIETHRERVEEVKQRLPYLSTADGVAVALGGRLAMIDILDKPETLAKVWNRVTEGFALDAIESHDTGREATEREVLGALRHARRIDWHPVEPVGLGEEFRACDDGMIASALFLDEVLLHASVSLARSAL